MLRTAFLVALVPALITGCASHRRGSSPGKPESGDPYIVQLQGDVALNMRWIPPGTFMMGSPGAEKGRKPDEIQTRVTLTRGYWMGATEVTIGQWKAVMGRSVREQLAHALDDETLHDFGTGKEQTLRDFMRFDRNDPGKYLTNENDRLPMYFVSWNDAAAFCDKLNRLEKGRLPKGYKFALPTEAQWEYACRAGSEETVDPGAIAWYGANSRTGYTGKGLGNPPAGSRNTGEKLPNAWGLYDMLGNLWEWCEDVYAPYPGGSVTDPSGPGTGIFHVNRGGSWGSGVNDERPANRAKNPQPEASAYRGFRIALRYVK
jgi:formylglycine-generating enzyme required for sulfatase activity